MLSGLDGATGNGLDNDIGLSFRACMRQACFQRVVRTTGHELTQVASGRFVLRYERVRSLDDRKRTKLSLSICSLIASSIESIGSLSKKRSFVTTLSVTLKLTSVVRGATKTMDLRAVFMSRKFKSLSSTSESHTVRVLGRLTKRGKLIKVVSRMGRLGRRVS